MVMLGYAQQDTASYWLWYASDTSIEVNGYKDNNGIVVIPAGKYLQCYTDTFRNFAIVNKPHVGFVAIDKNEEVLYEVFPFDNGPDEPHDGLFRIRIKGKIGYADAVTGMVVIPAQYDAAFYFENGVAKVGKRCKSIFDGYEHYIWQCKQWYYINTKGEEVSPPAK
jgi:hypothetical protein